MPRLKNPATGHNEVEDLRNAMSDDDNQADDAHAAEPISEVAKAEPDHAELERLIEPLLERLLSDGEWELLLAIRPQTMKDAQRDRRLSYTLKNRQAGFQGSDVLKWIADFKIPYALTPLANVMMTADVEEIAATVDPSRIYDSDVIEKHYGIKEGAIGRRIQGDTFQRLLRAGSNGDVKVVPSLSLMLARQIQLRRRAAEPSPPPAVNRSTAAPDKLSGPVTAELERLAALDAASDTACRAELLQQYGDILRRRSSPLDDDADRLTSICMELKFAPTRITGDIAALDRAAELEALIPQREAVSRELAEARAHKASLPKRHKEETLAASRAESSVFQKHSAIHQAAAQLKALKAGRPELFI